MVTEVSTLLIITQVGGGFKKTKHKCPGFANTS